MSKKLAALFAVVTLLAVGASVGIGKTVFSGGSAQGSSDELAKARSELQEMDASQTRLAETVASLRGQVERLASQKTELDRAIASKDQHIAKLVEQQKEPSATTDTVSATDPTAIDWAKLSEAFANSTELLARVSKLLPDMRALGRELTPEEMAALRELFMTFGAAASRARAQTPYPIVDGEILPQLFGPG